MTARTVTPDSNTPEANTPDPNRSHRPSTAPTGEHMSGKQASGGPGRWLLRAGSAVLVAIAATALRAGLASAHVAVNSPDAVRGGELALVSFRVPNESVTASTVKLTLTLPVATPVAEVQVQPLPGWSQSVTTRKFPAPTKVGDFTLFTVPDVITWTAGAAAGVKPGQFQIFQITIAPVPGTPTMTFTADQTYSDRKVVHWNQPPPADGSEADYPSPELTLAAAEPETASTTSPTGSASSATVSPGLSGAHPTLTVTASPVTTATTATTSMSSTTSGTSIAALAGAGVAVVLAGAALIVSLRRRPG